MHSFRISKSGSEQPTFKVLKFFYVHFKSSGEKSEDTKVCIPAVREYSGNMPIFDHYSSRAPHQMLRGLYSETEKFRLSHSNERPFRLKTAHRSDILRNVSIIVVHYAIY